MRAPTADLRTHRAGQPQHSRRHPIRPGQRTPQRQSDRPHPGIRLVGNYQPHPRHRIRLAAAERRLTR